MPGQATEAQHNDQEAIASILDDLVPLAAVTGAGCEPCAARLVERALQREGGRPALERTLRILAGVARAGCLTAVVGPEVVDRMKRALRAGSKALADREAAQQGPTCCAPPVRPRGRPDQTTRERQ